MLTLPAAAALLFVASAAVTWLWLRGGTNVRRARGREQVAHPS